MSLNDVVLFTIVFFLEIAPRDAFDLHYKTCKSNFGYHNTFNKPLSTCLTECKVRKRCVSIMYSRAMTHCALLEDNLDLTELKDGGHPVCIYAEVSGWTSPSLLACENHNCANNEKCVPASLDGERGHRCVPSECQMPPEIANAHALSSRCEIGTRNVYVCMSGYTREGDGSFECTTSALWTKPTIICQKRPTPITKTTAPISSTTASTFPTTVSSFPTTTPIFHSSTTADRTHSAENCVELQQENNGTLTNSTYVVDHAGQTLTIYCLYYHGYGYTFLSTTASGVIDMSVFYDTSDHVIIRHTRKDGVQYESRLEQIATFSDTPLSVQFNTNDHYKGPKNQGMEPYIFVGFIPKKFVEKESVQGWRVNGQDITFFNCDGNPNSYFAMFFNENNLKYTGSGTQKTGSLMTAWYKTATQVPVVEELPDEFYTPYYEVHHGGCGGYGYGKNYAEVTGVAVGVRFVEK